MGTANPALLRLRQQLASLDTTGTTQTDVLVGLASVVVDLAAVVSTLVPVTVPSESDEPGEGGEVADTPAETTEPDPDPTGGGDPA